MKYRYAMTKTYVLSLGSSRHKGARKYQLRGNSYYEIECILMNKIQVYAYKNACDPQAVKVYEVVAGKMRPVAGFGDAR
jgi:hypothetical protein